MTDQYAAPWQHIADGWARLGIGNHPSPFDISVYERFMLDAIRDVSHPQVILFGATPEIRDMIARYPNIQLLVIDINPEMIQAMTSLVKEPSKNEKHVVANWLTVNLPEHSFDAVLGDQIRENVAAEESEELYKTIHRLLKPTGLHVTRITSRFPHTPVYTPEEMIEKFSRIAPTKESISELWNIFTFQTHQNDISSTDYLFSMLEKYADRPYIRQYTRIFEEILPKHKEWNIGKSWDIDRVPVERYFDIVDQVQDDTFFHDSSYIFALKPRKI